MFIAHIYHHNNQKNLRDIKIYGERGRGVYHCCSSAAATERNPSLGIMKDMRVAECWGNLYIYMEIEEVKLPVGR